MPIERPRHHPFMHRGYPPGYLLVFILSIIFTFHISVVVYGASAYMEQFATPEVIASLYSIGSALAILAFLFISRVLRKVGNIRLTIILTIIEILALILMGLALSPGIAIVAFVVFLFLTPLLFLNIDVFTETLIGDNESITGSFRGLGLTLTSIASAAGPFVMGLIVGTDDSRMDLSFYFSAATLLLFILLTAVHARKFQDPVYKELRVMDALRSYWVSHDLRNVFMAGFVLQMFFAWTVVFIPLYMATEVGLSWAAIGSILGVGLLAYVIFEYPVGVLADKYFGEKEMMAAGFVILAITTSWISFMNGAPVWAWMLLMFVCRIGASLAEATSESYFFKHTAGSDVNIISFYRLSRPLATIFGALLGSAVLLFLPFQLLFVVLGFVLLSGAIFASRLNDTK